MDDEDAGQQRPDGTLECRPPTDVDLATLCRELNLRGARYLVIGGFAIIAAGLPRTTGAIDLLVASDLENERKVFGALETLPDRAVQELEAGELERYNVIRVADEILVDLMTSAGGITYDRAASEAVVRTLEGVPIPFASTALLWRMKKVTHRAKDAEDLLFLRNWFADRGLEPPRD